jgi:alkylation response protein AidB-like acyl-CoA dehydrogenase
VKTVIAPHANELDINNEFPIEDLKAIKESKLYGMAISRQYGGFGLSHLGQIRVFTALAEGSLATAFILSQHQGAAILIELSPHEALRKQWLPLLASGEAHATNGFNFLNLPADRAPMRAELAEGGYLLSGTLPWVTAAHFTDIIAAGAVLPDGNQIMVALPLKKALQQAGDIIQIDPPLQLASLTSSYTTSIHCQKYFIPDEDVLLGPMPSALKSVFRGATAYVPTALTAGHARASLSILNEVAAQKGGTAQEMADWVRRGIDRLEEDLTESVLMEDFDKAPSLRGYGNMLAARAAHFALIAGGGSGYKMDQTPQRLYREAGFFSVWSAAGMVIPETLSHLL